MPIVFLVFIILFLVALLLVGFLLVNAFAVVLSLFGFIIPAFGILEYMSVGFILVYFRGYFNKSTSIRHIMQEHFNKFKTERNTND